MSLPFPHSPEGLHISQGIPSTSSGLGTLWDLTKESLGFTFFWSLLHSLRLSDQRRQYFLSVRIFS